MHWCLISKDCSNRGLRLAILRISIVNKVLVHSQIKITLTFNRLLLIPKKKNKKKSNNKKFSPQMAKPSTTSKINPLSKPQKNTNNKTAYLSNLQEYHSSRSLTICAQKSGNSLCTSNSRKKETSAASPTLYHTNRTTICCLQRYCSSGWRRGHCSWLSRCICISSLRVRLLKWLLILQNCLS